MRLDIDTYKEIVSTITRNKTRSLLTGFGVFWGIFMLVVLLGGGQGLKESLNNNFEGFATNSAILFPHATEKPYHGYQKGRQWGMTTHDIEWLRQALPEMKAVTPMLMRWNTTAYNEGRKAACVFRGVTPEFQEVDEPDILYGRYINRMDMEQGRRVCVIGKKIYKALFPGGGDPTGTMMRVDSTYFTIVGVDYATGNITIGGTADEVVAVPLTLMQQTYNMGDSVSMICLVARPGIHMRSVMPRIRNAMAQKHDFAPDDNKALRIVNTEVMFSMLDSLFSGVNILVWLVGIGTLLAGAIGVSNIMMVTVRERTVEIGIRRAIGATPKMILSQIITESILLTIAAGMFGIVLGAIILQCLQTVNGTLPDGTVNVHYQVSFWTALGALLLLSVLGVLAGIAPALRAMSIKPVDAMREE